jgi:hypothetical protein
MGHGCYLLHADAASLQASHIFEISVFHSDENTS